MPITGWRRRVIPGFCPGQSLIATGEVSELLRKFASDGVISSREIAEGNAGGIKIIQPAVRSRAGGQPACEKHPEVRVDISVIQAQKDRGRIERSGGKAASDSLECHRVAVLQGGCDPGVCGGEPFGVQGMVAT